MFRRKEEGAQEELDVTAQGDEKEARPAGGATASYTAPAGAANQDAAARPAAPAGRAPAPAAAPVSGYRAPQSGAAQPAAPTASAPAAPQRAAAPVAPAQPLSTGSSSSAAASSSSGMSSSNKGNKRILTVGNDILLKGEIATCDRLVIEGMVDATLKDVHTVEISETGSFKGTAEIQDAEISGLFEGDLTVRNRLTIYSTGRVRGKISYGEIEIERGGQLTGEIRIGESAGAKGDEAKDKKAA